MAGAKRDKKGSTKSLPLLSNPTLSTSPFVPHDLAAPVCGAADGPLSGLTFAAKDMYDVAGYATGGGNPTWLEMQRPAVRNATALQQLIDAGATLVGKTICDEFFYSITGANAHYGIPINPHAPDRLPGGSSSGSASAVALGACDFALGSDTAGSIRVPASFCGLYGLRPTHGRIDLMGAMAMAPSFDTAGWLASSPSVFRTVGRVLLDASEVSATVERVIVLDDAFAEADHEVRQANLRVLELASEYLPQRSHTIVAPDGLDDWRETMRVLQAYEVWRTFGSFIETHDPGLGSGTAQRMKTASSVSKSEAGYAREKASRVRDRVCQLARPGTLLVLPATPISAPPIDASDAALDTFRLKSMRLSCIASLAGVPQLVVPTRTNLTMPTGFSLIAWPGGDEVLIALAAYLGYAGARSGLQMPT